MKISLNKLSLFTNLPSDPKDTHKIFESVGLEVKRTEEREINKQQHTIFDIEILANRGDHYCYYGMAREIYGRTNNSLIFPTIKALKTTESSTIEVSNETELCLKYSLTYLEKKKNIESKYLPSQLSEYLNIADIQTISPIIDISNIVNIEIGQPIHVFDADKINGRITIRLSREGETALPLFQENRVILPSKTLVIADTEKILAIAGVIGCQESSVTNSTKKFLLESATFDPISIRKTSKLLNIRTDSSIRFERGGDLDLVIKGAERAVYLLEEYCGLEHKGTTYITKEKIKKLKNIPFSPKMAREFLSITLNDKEIIQCLERYNFIFDDKNNNILVPKGRIWDVEYPADLYEEIAKSIGYEKIPSILPTVKIGANLSNKEIIKSTVDEIMINQGFWETIVDAFYNEETVEKLIIDKNSLLKRHVNILNSEDKNYSLLKNNALAQMIEATDRNLRMKEQDLKLYEWTTIFKPNKEAKNGLCDEIKLLTCIVYGNDTEKSWDNKPRSADIYFLKGIINEIANTLKLPLVIQSKNSNLLLSNSLHPQRQGVILLNDSTVGIIGEVHPQVCKNFSIKRQRPCYFELNYNALESHKDNYQYFPPPSQPHTIRNLAFTLPIGFEAKTLLNELKSAAPSWLAYAKVVDSYEHEHNKSKVTTLTIELGWSNQISTKTSEELNRATENLIYHIEKHLSKKGVTLRA